jgi:dTDP-4-amino-4,6-dideoxygalactose transaminase
LINVTKTFLPPLEEYIKHLELIWSNGWVTNQGPLAEELECKLKKYLDVKNLLLVSNGTIALQIAIKALGLTGEIITTPYSYVATTTSIIWENCTPVFCDIEDKTYCMDPDKIESLITDKTSAIIPTHVYGLPCDVNKINLIADKYKLKVIYDGAHAFGVRVNNQSIYNFGDASTISFHATKLFHTIEGGAIITRDDKLAEKIFLHRAFGHLDDDYISIGINGRTSEFHAAMGLCNLPRIDEFINKRKEINEHYKKCLKDLPLEYPLIHENVIYNYSYFPVIFQSEEKMTETKDLLAQYGIVPRRYFYPSLNNLPYIEKQNCPVSDDIAKKVLCLPVYHSITLEDIEMISKIVKQSINT